MMPEIIVVISMTHRSALWPFFTVSHIYLMFFAFFSTYSLCCLYNQMLYANILQASINMKFGVADYTCFRLWIFFRRSRIKYSLRIATQVWSHFFFVPLLRLVHVYRSSGPYALAQWPIRLSYDYNGAAWTLTVFFVFRTVQLRPTQSLNSTEQFIAA